MMMKYPTTPQTPRATLPCEMLMSEKQQQLDHVLWLAKVIHHKILCSKVI